MDISAGILFQGYSGAESFASHQLLIEEGDLKIGLCQTGLPEHL